MIGGWLSNNLWPWMFFLNIPVCIFSLAVIWILLKEEKHTPPTTPVDSFGMILLFIWVGLIQIAMNRWNIDDWFRSTFINSLFIIAAIAFFLFIIWELYYPDPFIDLTLLKKRNFCLPALTTGLGMGILFSSFVLDSLWVQEVLGYTPAWAGLTLAPVGVFPLIFFPLLSRFVNRIDLRFWVISSFMLYACTFFWLSHVNVYVSFWNLALPRLVQGVGFAFFTIPNSLLAVQGAAHDRLTGVIAFFSFMRMFFVGLGVSLTITLWEFREAFYQTRITSRTDAFNPLFTKLMEPFEQLTHSIPKSYGLSYETLLNHASTLALADIYYLYAWLFVALGSLVLFYKKSET